MKNLNGTLKIAVLIGVAILLAATSANAQTQAMRVTIPFQFLVGAETLPAGDYFVATDAARNSIELRSAKSALYVLARDQKGVEVSDTPTLIFKKYGKTHFLRKVMPAGCDWGFALPATSAEAEMARNAASVQVAIRVK